MRLARPTATALCSTDAAARLEDVFVWMAAIEKRVAQLERRQLRVDPPVALLSSIAAAFGNALFTSHDLVRHARHDAELAAVLGDADARRIGVWLRRLHRHADAPYGLERVTRDGAGTIWMLRVDVDRHTDRRPAHDAGAHSAP